MILEPDIVACMCTDLVRRRARLLEDAFFQFFKKAGSQVRKKQFVHDLGLGTSTTDNRQIEIVAYGLPLHHGVPLWCDATIVSPLDSRGRVKYNSHRRSGAALRNAEGRKRRRYPELLRSRGAKFLVLGAEAGGRWSDDVIFLLPSLAFSRAEASPALLRGSVRHACLARWWSLLSIPVQKTIAATFLDDCARYHFATTSIAPLGILLDGEREAPDVSRLGPH